MPLSDTWRHFPHEFHCGISQQEDWKYKDFVCSAWSRRIVLRHEFISFCFYYYFYCTFYVEQCCAAPLEYKKKEIPHFFTQKWQTYKSPLHFAKDVKLYFWAWQTHVGKNRTLFCGEHLFMVSKPNTIRNLVMAYLHIWMHTKQQRVKTTRKHVLEYLSLYIWMRIVAAIEYKHFLFTSNKNKFVFYVDIWKFISREHLFVGYYIFSHLLAV